MQVKRGDKTIERVIPARGVFDLGGNVALAVPAVSRAGGETPLATRVKLQKTRIGVARDNHLGGGVSAVLEIQSTLDKGLIATFLRLGIPQQQCRVILNLEHGGIRDHRVTPQGYDRNSSPGRFPQVDRENGGVLDTARQARSLPTRAVPAKQVSTPKGMGVGSRR